VVNRVVVARDAGRVVVAIDEVSGRRILDLRVLAKGQDFVAARLVRLAMTHRQPLVSALAVAHEPRRNAVHRARLQIFAHGDLAGSEVGDIALHVDIDEVLRYVHALQRVLELVEVAGAVDEKKRLELLRRAKAHVLHTQGWPPSRRVYRRNDRPTDAARHDKRESRNARGNDAYSATIVGAESFRYANQRLAGTAVQRREAAWRSRIWHDLLGERIGYVDQIVGRSPGDPAVVAVDNPGSARNAAAEHRLAFELETHRIEGRRRGRREMRIVCKQRTPVRG